MLKILALAFPECKGCTKKKGQNELLPGGMEIEIPPDGKSFFAYLIGMGRSSKQEVMMRRSTKYPVKYTWDRFVADLLWLLLLLVLLVKVMEAITFEPAPYGLTLR